MSLRRSPKTGTAYNVHTLPPAVYLCPAYVAACNRFVGASDDSITRTIDNALGFPSGTPAVVRDSDDGTVLAISDSIPDGLTLDATPAIPNVELAGAWLGAVGVTANGVARNGSPGLVTKHSDDGFHGGGSDNGKAPGGAEVFRGELLKFERVNAHLANERTWLAWVRTALSVLGVALSLLSLADDLGSVSMDSLALVLGVAFVLCTLFTYVTGWLRYARVKEVLAWQGAQVKAKFGRFGLGYQARFLAIALILTVPLYIAGGVNVVASA